VIAAINTRNARSRYLKAFLMNSFLFINFLFYWSPFQLLRFKDPLSRFPQGGKAKKVMHFIHFFNSILNL
jgi:hypothetical protein